MASCSMMLFAWSSERHVDFTAVQAPLAEDSAPAAALAEKSALASAIGSKGMSISSIGLWSFLILLMLTFTILVPKSTPTMLPSTETNFPFIHFPPCEPSDLIFDLSSVQ